MSASTHEYEYEYILNGSGKNIIFWHTVRHLNFAENDWGTWEADKITRDGKKGRGRQAGAGGH